MIYTCNAPLSDNFVRYSVQYQLLIYYIDVSQCEGRGHSSLEMVILNSWVVDAVDCGYFVSQLLMILPLPCPLCSD